MTKRETVKINEDLLKRVNEIIKDKDKKIVYSNAKQFVNIAVLKLLKKEEEKEKVIAGIRCLKNENN